MISPVCRTSGARCAVECRLPIYRLDPHWSVGAVVSQDLLGRNGGALAALDLSYRDRLAGSTQWSAGARLAFGNGTYMRSDFGVPESAAGPNERPAFAPGAGPRDVHVGIGLTTAITPRWIAFAGAGASSLLGDAASSPFTKSRFG
jgi:MipA family protein